MVDEDRYCIDIVTQIWAVRAALRRVEEEVLRDHVAHCVEGAIASGNKSDQRQKISELMDVIGRSDRQFGLGAVHAWPLSGEQRIWLRRGPRSGSGPEADPGILIYNFEK